ncbi:transposase [Geosporobacter ferrireducens]|uniref:transposase n=1 Tax=Geosporobacter ferrireducens TaxID=1424294 RepID=UPI00139BDF01|nr:transposase [Geosporobacter ferrireducens]
MVNIKHKEYAIIHLRIRRRKKAIDENTKELVYRNTKACKVCEYKDKYTTSKRGRAITRDINQDILDKVDERSNSNKELYKQRKVIVEHPFGTIKRWWGYSYFLTRGLKSVKTEASLTFLAYNIKRVINILGIREMTSRLIGKKPPNNLLNFKTPILFHKSDLILIK